MSFRSCVWSSSFHGLQQSIMRARLIFHGKWKQPSEHVSTRFSLCNFFRCIMMWARTLSWQKRKWPFEHATASICVWLHSKCTCCWLGTNLMHWVQRGFKNSKSLHVFKMWALLGPAHGGDSVTLSWQGSGDQDALFPIKHIQKIHLTILWKQQMISPCLVGTMCLQALPIMPQLKPLNPLILQRIKRTQCSWNPTNSKSGVTPFWKRTCEHSCVVWGWEHTWPSECVSASWPIACIPLWTENVFQMKTGNCCRVIQTSQIQMSQVQTHVLNCIFEC